MLEISYSSFKYLIPSCQSVSLLSYRKTPSMYVLALVFGLDQRSPTWSPWAPGRLQGQHETPAGDSCGPCLLPNGPHTVSGKILQVKHRSRLKKQPKPRLGATHFLIKKKKAFLYGEVFNEAMRTIAKTMLKDRKYRL